MHRQIGTAFFQRHFEFFDKQAFAADFAQRAVQNLVALGGHAQNGDFATSRLQQVLQMVGLPQSQSALTGGDGEVNGAQNRDWVCVFSLLNASMGSLMVFPRQN
jgi:hypothetical protein